MPVDPKSAKKTIGFTLFCFFGIFEPKSRSYHVGDINPRFATADEVTCLMYDKIRRKTKFCSNEFAADVTE